MNIKKCYTSKKNTNKITPKHIVKLLKTRDKDKVEKLLQKEMFSSNEQWLDWQMTFSIQLMEAKDR